MLELEHDVPEPDPTPSRYPLGWVEAIFAILAFLLFAWMASVFIAFVQGIGLALSHPGITGEEATAQLRESTTRAVVATMLGQLLFLGYLRWRTGARARPRGGEVLGLHFRFPEVGILIAPALALAPIAGAAVLVFLASLFLGEIPQPDNAPIAMLVEHASPMDMALLFILGVAIAPIVEELFFRGLLFGVCRRYLSQGMSILVISVLFVLAHYAQTGGYWPSMVAIFAVALVLTTQRAAFGSVIPCWITHACYNSILMLISVIGFLLTRIVDPQQLMYYMHLARPLMPPHLQF